MQSLATQVAARSSIGVLHSSCTNFRVQSVNSSSALVSLSGGLNVKINTRVSKSNQWHRVYPGPRGSMVEVPTAGKGSESRSGIQDVFDNKETSTAEDTSGKFNWLEQWYPVAIVKHVDKQQPLAETIIGRDLVIWWDRVGNQWQAFDDACPHRMAPLSEGRIHESGHLQCSYHGWTFAPTSGSCTMIPQLDKGREAALQSKRACAKVYVCREHQGMIWVWMDRAEGAEERSAANPPPSVPALDDPNVVYDLGMLDLTYGYEALIENLLDPSHVHFAHHGLQGKRNLAKPLEFEVTHSDAQGFAGIRDGTMPLRFFAPVTAYTVFQLQPPKAPKGHPLALKLREWIMSRKKAQPDEPKREISTIFYCIPSSPGKSKLIFSFPRNFAQIVFKLTPRWLGHVKHMLVIDSDLWLLHKMQHRIEERGGDVNTLYYTPAQVDAYVLEFRKWLKNFANNSVDYGAKSSPLPPSPLRKVVFDRHTAHVAKCSICSNAVAKFRLLESVLHALPFALVGLVAVAALNSWRGLSRLSVPLVCLAVASAIAKIYLSKWVEKTFEYHDYNHAVIP